MNELTLHSSQVIEFSNCAELSLNEDRILADNSTNTDNVVQTRDATTGTTIRHDVAAQTEQGRNYDSNKLTAQDEKELNRVLKRLAKVMEAALDDGGSSIPKHILERTTMIDYDNNVQPYQSLTIEKTSTTTIIKTTDVATPTDEMKPHQALACWLSVYTNNAPALLITTVTAHDNWCDHIGEQYLQLYIPKRMTARSDFLQYQHAKSVPLKACLGKLCVNSYDKSIFAGAMLDNHITIWQHLTSSNDLVELHSVSTIGSLHDCAIDMSWATVDQLLTSHATGYVLHWHVGKHMTLKNELAIRMTKTDDKDDKNNGINLNELCALESLSAYAFVVGSKNGYIYYCRHNVHISRNNPLDIIVLYKHDFMITKLLKTLHNNCLNVISCDLSGQVIVHDLINDSEDYNQHTKISYLLPLPFKNAISCPQAQEFNTIYSPGTDGAIECFNIKNRSHNVVKGAVQANGSGNFIECSDNGNWIVIGLYGNEVQIFYVDN